MRCGMTRPQTNKHCNVRAVSHKVIWIDSSHFDLCCAKKSKNVFPVFKYRRKQGVCRSCRL